MPLLDHDREENNSPKSYTNSFPEKDQGEPPADSWPYCKTCKIYKPLRWVIHKNAHLNFIDLERTIAECVTDAQLKWIITGTTLINSFVICKSLTLFFVVNG